MRTRRSGYTLAECMVYIGVLTIVMGVAWLLYYGLTAHSRGIQRNVEDVIRAMQAGERWRESVRTAAEPPRLEDGVLHLTHEGGETLYRFAHGQVERRPGDGAWEPFLPRVAASRMQLDEGKHVRSWRWEVELASRKKAGMRPLFAFRAARRP